MLPASAAVELPASGEVAVEIAGRAGGRVKVDVAGADGKPVSGHWIVRDDRDAQVLQGWFEAPLQRLDLTAADWGASQVTLRGEFRFRVTAGALRASRAASLRLLNVAGGGVLVGGSDPSETWRLEAGLLEPGWYRLEVRSDGYVTASVNVRIEPMVTTRATVTLMRESDDR
jgi:hypothetical protein